MGDKKPILRQIYRTSLSLLTDFYQLTMAYAGWKSGYAAQESVFELFFRNHPFSGSYAISCGLDFVLGFIESFRFNEEDLVYVSSLTGNDGKPLFEKEFISYLRDLRLEVDVDAIEEGRVVFAQEPLIRVSGPLAQCQLLETPILNFINFQTLIATKAARVKSAAGEAPVVEFGLRRAQGVDGALTASRAAYIGGADATSNLLAGKLFGLPVRGTHGHSWVMSFEQEYEAFLKYAEALPNHCVFLVDTYNSLKGVKNAIEVGRLLQQKGKRLAGVRLDSGDLAYLSIEARRMLDEAGFKDAAILASNDLDEYLISNLNQQGAQISLWGVGTQLVTAFDQPALGGVYKLVAIRDHENWKYKLKISEQVAKTTTPGIHQVRRFLHGGMFEGDMIFDLNHPPKVSEQMIVDPLDHTRRKQFSSDAIYEDLLIPVVRAGKVCYRGPKISEIKKSVKKDLDRLHPTILRLVNPHQFPVGLEQELHELKSRMVLEMRGFTSSDGIERKE